MKKANPQIEVLNWFLDFLSLDLESLSDDEWSKWQGDAVHYFHAPGVVHDEYGSLSTQPLRKQVHLRILAEKENLKVVHKKLKTFLEKWLGSSGAKYAFENVKWVFFTDNKGVMRIQPRFKIVRDLTIQRLTMFVKANLCLVMHSIPREAIKTCRECGKYFLHLSKKPKYYCNPTCSSRGSARRKRETDPEGYRRQQRQIMRRKYREQKARKLGIPVAEVKIQKRVED